MHFRNNLFLGRDTPGRGISALGERDGVFSLRLQRLPPEPRSPSQYIWIAPKQGELRDYEPGPRTRRRFTTLAELRAATGQETHGVEVDYDIFEERAPAQIRRRRHAVYHAANLDFRLKPGSKAVDAGVRLPNVNDDFTGQAPDLGAYENGKPLPVYGPRTAPAQPFYQ